MKAHAVQEAVVTASTALQSIQLACGRDNVPAARVRFPRGFMTNAVSHRVSLPNIGTEVQRRNASYALITVDVLRWLAIRTDLNGAALSVVAKQIIAMFGLLCEWLTKAASAGQGSKQSYRDRAVRLAERQIIDEALKDELLWVWEMRCYQHLYGVRFLEHARYSRADVNRAQRAYLKLCHLLIEQHGRAN